MKTTKPRKEVRTLATRDQVNDSVNRVATGGTNDEDWKRTRNQAKVAGSEGSAARKALEDANKPKPTNSWF